ncbi:hypothetical protein P43SY_000867 [Pythium insidiosum]|uniref:tRNA/rRNA methyltransferase SpoU type domain-containing protein n=1 Tax=Pythium insidiosum TaxID=114742 RepID=A0AAD5M4E5_PYTIN|nr:hypothetical protein P43SY_000867 [Pythium insidiosum]
MAAPQHHRSYLILNNVQKNKNIKNMLISASAFGVSEVFIVGQRKFDLEEHAAFLAKLRVPITRIATLKECREHCVQHGIRILGVEIMGEAKSLLDEPFVGDTAFIMGNEGSGMNSAQVGICDGFVYIPQYGGGTASLNVTVAASIIMQSFALWARIPSTDSAGRDVYKLIDGAEGGSDVRLDIPAFTTFMEKRAVGDEGKAATTLCAFYNKASPKVMAVFERCGWSVEQTNAVQGFTISWLERRARMVETSSPPRPTVTLVGGDGQTLRALQSSSVVKAENPVRVEIWSWAHAMHEGFLHLMREHPESVRVHFLDSVVEQVVRHRQHFDMSARLAPMAEEITKSKCIKHVLLPDKRSQRRLNALLHATKKPMRTMYMIGLSLAIMFWTLEKAPGQYLSIIASLLQVTPVLTLAISLYYDVVILVLRTYEFWYLTLANWLSNIFVAIEFGDARVAATIMNAVGFQIVILTDASSRAMTNMFMGSMLTAITHTAFALSVAVRALDAMTPFPVFDHGRWSVESSDVIVNGFLTLVAILLRNAYRRFVYIHSSVAHRRLRCILYRTALRFEPCDASLIPSRPVAISSAGQHGQPPTTVVQIQLVPFPKRILVDDVVWRLSTLSKFALQRSTQLALQLTVVGASSLSVVTAAGYGGGNWQRVLVGVALASAVTTSALFVAHCNRVLLLHLLRSFDFLFIIIQLSLAHFAMAYLDHWGKCAVGLAGRWIWITTFLSYDALTPVMREKLGFGPRLAASVVGLQIVGQALLMETLYRPGNQLQDRTLLRIDIGAKELHVSAIAFVIGREFTLFLWWLRLVWRFLHIGIDGLVLIQGALEYEDARAVYRPRSIFQLKRFGRRVGPAPPLNARQHDALPVIDLAKGVKHVVVPNPTALRVVNQFLRRGKHVLPLLNALGMACVFSFWFVDARIGRSLAAVGTVLLLAPQLATLLVVRYDMVMLLLKSYEFWYITIINTLCTILICFEYQDVRGAAAAIGSVAIENALMPDANYRVVSSMVVYSSFAGLIYFGFATSRRLKTHAD